VTVTIFDLMGYLVKEWTFEKGDVRGGIAGDNRVKWDGTNEAGNKVATGGYICRIIVESKEGRKITIRKIAVIH